MNQNDIKSIKQAYSKGNAPAAIAKLLDYSIYDVLSVLGIDETESAYDMPEYSLAALETLANEALFKLVHDINHNQAAYKPNEALAIIKEALDRTQGRAAQMVQVDSKQTVTHEHVMRIEPSEAYKMLIDSGVSVGECGDQAIPEAEIVDGGG